MKGFWKLWPSGQSVLRIVMTAPRANAVCSVAWAGPSDP